MSNLYPLSWPPGFPRSTKRESGRFKTTLHKALGNVRTELSRFGNDTGKPVTQIVISSNVTLGQDNPSDPGIAVWFLWDGEQRCVPVDRYDTPASNLQAIATIVAARRTEVRHGTLALVRATFRGFTPAIAGPGQHHRAWREVLGFEPGSKPTREAILAHFRDRAIRAHPDRGGTDADMAELNAARASAIAEVGLD